MELFLQKEDGTCNSVTLKSVDGQAFIVDAYCAKKSEYLANKMEGKKEDIELTFQNIEGKVLKKITDYLVHFKVGIEPSEIPKPLKEPRIDKYISKWEYDYIYSFTMQDCIDLINAAEHLGINSLLKLTCARLAARMLELDVEEVTKTFFIECDMNDEESNRFKRYPLQNNI